MPVVFRRHFQHDLAAGFDWYEEQRSGLGEEFLSAVELTIKRIELYPEMFASVHGDVRRAIVSRFAFTVFYLVEPQRVVVLRMILLFTDFGASDLYVGQVKAVLAERAPRVPVIDLLHDAPAFNVKTSAYLLAALARTGSGGASGQSFPCDYIPL